LVGSLVQADLGAKSNSVNGDPLFLAGVFFLFRAIALRYERMPQCYPSLHPSLNETNLNQNIWITLTAGALVGNFLIGWSLFRAIMCQ
jgi:hypothetical protein